MEPNSHGIDHDFEYELMMCFPGDMSCLAQSYTISPSATTWPPIPLPSGLEDWEHHDEDEIAEKVLAHAGSSGFQPRSLYFQVLRTWLQIYDNQDEECRLQQSGCEFWPTRAIHVGNHNKLRLVEEPDGDRDYLVLSHCWGSPTKEEWNRFCTTRENYHQRLDKFRFDELPKTFQDAIVVTRELGKQYLWIDALCIIQGPDGEWESEAGRMEDVFAKAYCTIAANSASGWKDGFLVSGLWDQLDPRKRAWVLQERVLSRRIIHFTAGGSHGRQGHTFWECGGVIYCQQFSRLIPPFSKYLFERDPYFPALLKTASYNRALVFIQSLFQQYSQAGLTYKSDRDTAIFSLLKRIGHELDTEVRYGIIRCFLGSLLLWKRNTSEVTPPIDFGRRTVPSWSWMAYDGSIKFIIDYEYALKIPRAKELEFTQDGKGLNVRVRQFENCQLCENKRSKYAVYAGTDKIGSLWYDLEGQIEFKHCVVIGTGVTIHLQEILYVLMIREESDEGVYKRLGAGILHDGYVSLESEAARLV